MSSNAPITLTFVKDKDEADETWILTRLSNDRFQLDLHNNSLIIDAASIVPLVRLAITGTDDLMIQLGGICVGYECFDGDSSSCLLDRLKECIELTNHVFKI